MATEPSAKPRRDKGQGGLHYDQTRKVWVGTVDLGRDASGRRERRSVSGRTKTEAKNKLATLRGEAADGVLGPARMTVAQLLESWLAKGLPPTMRSTITIAKAAFMVRTLIVPRLGGRTLRALSCDDVDEALGGMISYGYSGSTVKQAHSTLTRALRWGERRGYVGRNVSALCDTPEGPVKRSRSLTHQQAKALLAACEDEPLGGMLVVGLMLGLRPGELTGLPWDAIDFDAGTLAVRQSLHHDPSGRLSIGAPKTEASHRVLAMPAPVASTLRTRRQIQLQDRVRVGSTWHDTGLVFTTTIGTPLDPANVRRETRKLTGKAGIGTDWCPRELRHTAASIMAAAGVPLQHVADTMGHATLRVTAEVYRHRIVAVADAAVTPMEFLADSA